MENSATFASQSQNLSSAFQAAAAAAAVAASGAGNGTGNGGSGGGSASSPGGVAGSSVSAGFTPFQEAIMSRMGRPLGLTVSFVFLCPQ